MVRAADPQLVSAVRAKRCVFTVTAGRSGTNHLQQLFALLPGVRSVHEDEPDFVRVMRRTQRNPEVGYRFCLEQKLPFIASVPEGRYVETSHLWGKGFVECFLRAGVAPDAVVLRRPPREIAASLFGIQTIPSRTGPGVMYLVGPEDPGVMPLPQWELLSDYQLCFWYALEMERRQRRYAAMLRDAGAVVAEITLAELASFERFAGMATELGFSVDPGDAALRASFAACAATRHNQKPKQPLQASPAQFADAEELVWERVAWSEPLLRAHVERQYAPGAAKAAA